MVPGEEWEDHMMKEDISTALTPKLLEPSLLANVETFVKGLLPKFQPHMFARSKKALTERPKIVVGIPHPDHGGLGIYKWGQPVEDYGMIEAAPEELSELFEYMSKEYGEEFNHLIMTLYKSGADGIAPHSDKSFSRGNKGRCETSSIIADLSIGATRTFRFVTPGKEGRKCIASLDLTHGSHFAFKGALNGAVEHEVPRQPEVTAARISMVFRRVDKEFIHATDDLYYDPKDGDWKQWKKNLGIVRQFRRQYVFSEKPAEEPAAEPVAEAPEPAPEPMDELVES
jgi:hypothetical protein